MAEKMAEMSPGVLMFLAEMSPAVAAEISPAVAAEMSPACAAEMSPAVRVLAEMSPAAKAEALRVRVRIVAAMIV